MCFPGVVNAAALGEAIPQSSFSKETRAECFPCRDGFGLPGPTCAIALNTVEFFQFLAVDPFENFLVLACASILRNNSRIHEEIRNRQPKYRRHYKSHAKDSHCKITDQ